MRATRLQRYWRYRRNIWQYGHRWNCGETHMNTKKISVLAYDGCMGMEVFGLCDTLLLANRVARGMRGPAAAALFDVRVVSLAGGSVTAAGGLSIGTARLQPSTDLLVVPGMDIGDRNGCAEPQRRLAAEVQTIARLFAKGVPVAAICVGAFLLAEAGLLDGRRASTAWLFTADLARRFPSVLVDPVAMLVEDGGVITTGAFTATFDLAIHLIQQSASPKEARAIARIALLNQRTSQAAFVDASLAAQPQSGRFSDRVQGWLRERLDQPYDLAVLAAAFHVSGRTMLRRLRAETGQSPLAYLQGQRIDKAKRLLESSAISVAQVTERVGYLDVATFSSLFKRLTGHSPAEYRRRFSMSPRMCLP
ncbi:MAG: GlxA family transcriptional regulator [Massilia sp.]